MGVISMSGIHRESPADAPEPPEPTECPRCSGLGSEIGTSEPCAACLGAGEV